METKDIIQSDYNLGKLTSTSEKYYRMDANVALSLTTAKGPLLLKQNLVYQAGCCGQDHLWRVESTLEI